MNTALTSVKSPLNGRSIAVAVILAMLMSIPPKEAQPEAGPFTFFHRQGQRQSLLHGQITDNFWWL
jgi:hypothetical protein